MDTEILAKDTSPAGCAKVDRGDRWIAVGHHFVMNFFVDVINGLLPEHMCGRICFPVANGDKPADNGKIIVDSVV